MWQKDLEWDWHFGIETKHWLEDLGICTSEEKAEHVLRFVGSFDYDYCDTFLLTKTFINYKTCTFFIEMCGQHVKMYMSTHFLT